MEEGDEEGAPLCGMRIILRRPLWGPGAEAAAMNTILAVTAVRWALPLATARATAERVPGGGDRYGKGADGSTGGDGASDWEGAGGGGGGESNGVAGGGGAGWGLGAYAEGGGEGGIGYSAGGYGGGGAGGTFGSGGGGGYAGGGASGCD